MSGDSIVTHITRKGERQGVKEKFFPLKFVVPNVMASAVDVQEFDEAEAMAPDGMTSIVRSDDPTSLRWTLARKVVKIKAAHRKSELVREEAQAIMDVATRSADHRRNATETNRAEATERLKLRLLKRKGLVQADPRETPEGVKTVPKSASKVVPVPNTGSEALAI